MSAKLCRSKEGGPTGAAVFLLARCLWATATCGMKASKHRATTINRNFIFTPQAVSHVARSCGVCLCVLRMLSLIVERQASGRVVDGTAQSAHSHPGEDLHYGTGASNKTGGSYRAPRSLRVENTRLNSMTVGKELTCDRRSVYDAAKTQTSSPTAQRGRLQPCY